MAAARDARLRKARPLALMGLAAAAALAVNGCTAVPALVPSATPGPCATGSVKSTVGYAKLPTGSFSQSVAGAARRTITVPPLTVAFSDFTAADGTIDGAAVGSAATGLVGAGPSKTVFEVGPGTSTHGSEVPTTFPATNQLNVLRVGTLDTSIGTILRGFGLRGTEQGHLYNGLRVERVHGLRASDIRVTGIPGGAASPPGETFGINDFRTVDSQWSKVVVDGAGVGASGFGVNNSGDIRICDTTSKNNRFGMGFAFWQSSGITCVDCRALDNGRAGFNFERVTGTTTLIRPVATGNTYGVRISNDLATGTFRIVDPKLTDGRFTVTVPYRYNGATNRQRLSDITLIVDGKKRPDLLRIQRY